MKITYEDFKKEMLNNGKAYLPEELSDAEVSIEHVDKLNHSYDALIIRMPGSHAAASFDLSGFYGTHKGESSGQMIGALKDVLSGLDLEDGRLLQDAGNWLENYANVKDSLYVRCSNAVTNFTVLNDCPHTRLGDLAFTAHVGLNWAEGSAPVYTTTVTDRLLDTWGISREELFRDAIDNSAKRLPVQISPLSDMLMGMMGTEMPGQAEPSDGLYVLTNIQSTDGAAAVIYPGVLEEMQKQIGDFCMIPSSVHEFLLLSDEADVSIEALEAMVRDMNRNVLKEEEFLSDQVYHYDGKEKVMEPVRDFVKRRALEESRKYSHEMSEQKNKTFKPNPQANPGMGLTM